jgi:two-component system CheB/CheR fusion protein
MEIALIQTTLLNDLIQDLADVVRVQTGQLPIARERVDLVDLVKSVVELARPISESQDIRIDLAAESLPVSADPRRLRQVMLNLIANAVHHGASPSGVDVRVRRDDGTAEVAIVDYGQGIPTEHQGHVFERFYRGGAPKSEPGLGVGLYLVHAIVAAHDGTITFEQTDGQGTTFVMRLPLIEEPT